MTNRKLKAYLREHPELLDDYFVLSAGEAQAMLQAEGQVMTFEALIARAKRDNPQYSATQWADYDRCIARAKKRVAIKQKQERHIVLPHRTFRVALAGALVLLLVFFALTPLGRTLAASLYAYVITVIGDQASMTPNSDAASGQMGLPGTGGNKPLTFESMETFEEQSGLTALVLQEDWLRIVDFEGEYVPNAGYTIILNYEDIDGNWLKTVQMWPNGQEIAARTEDEAYHAADIGNGLTFFYGFDPVNNALDGVLLWESSGVVVGAERGIDTNKIISALLHASSLY